MTRGNKYWLTILLFTAVLVVVCVWVYFPPYFVSKYRNVLEAEAYAGIYEAVNALFTSLAFALLIYTALMQREELKLQREELRATREELARSAKSQEDLVRLTKEANDFQKHVRKRDTWPELEILKNVASTSRGTGASSRLSTEIILAPKFTPLRVTNVVVKNTTTAVIDQQLLESHFLNRIIEVGKQFVITLYHNRPHDIHNVVIEIHLTDIDETNNYEQRLISDDQLFRISESKALISISRANLS